jgi:hypothetical protein
MITFSSLIETLLIEFMYGTLIIMIYEQEQSQLCFLHLPFNITSNSYLMNSFLSFNRLILLEIILLLFNDSFT